MTERFHMGQTMAECGCENPECVRAERCLAIPESVEVKNVRNSVIIKGSGNAVRYQSGGAFYGDDPHINAPPAFYGEGLTREQAEKSMLIVKADGSYELFPTPKVDATTERAIQAIQNMIACARPYFRDDAQMLALSEARWLETWLSDKGVDPIRPLAEAALEAAGTFERYAELHAAKEDTPENRAKVEANIENARKLRAAVAVALNDEASG